MSRFLSPNEQGDYMYGGDGPCVEDAVNCAWTSDDTQPLASGQQNQRGRYIYSNYGPIIDLSHYDFATAADVIQQVGLGQSISLGPNYLYFDPCGRFANIRVDYRVSGPIADKYGVALAIWMDYEVKFETAQPTIWFPTTVGIGGASNFAIEDLPTDYLAFWAAAQADATGKNIHDPNVGQNLLAEIIDMLGGASERGDREPPHCTGSNPGCPSQNKEFTPRVEKIEVLHHYVGICPMCIDFSTRMPTYFNKAWPEGLTLIGGRPLRPVNDGSWQLERCIVSGVLAHQEACRAGLGR